MAKKEDACTIEIKGNFSIDLLASLQMLYYPLIKDNALMLYYTLLALGSRNHKVTNHILMCTLTSQSMERLIKSRHILEQYLLVKTFYSSKDNKYIYQVYMPIEGSTFLRHEVFGRLFLQTMGKQVYEFSKISFAMNEEDRQGYSEITMPFENVLKENWKDIHENQFNKIKPEVDQHMHNNMPLTFNFDIFLSGLSNTVFPIRARSKENLQTIGELATIHGISEKEMRKLVSHSIDPRRQVLRIADLRKRVRSSKTTMEPVSNSNPYAAAPISFLQQKQHGIKVSESDKKLIESLISDYKLPIEVCNYLIEYCLDSTNQELKKNYVEKIAATWARLQIDTLNKAQEHVKTDQFVFANTVKYKSKSLPEWYNQAPQGVDDPEEKAKLLEKIDKMRGK